MESGKLKVCRQKCRLGFLPQQMLKKCRLGILAQQIHITNWALRFLLITFVGLFLFCNLPTDAETVVQPQIATTTDCIRTFPISYDKLYNLTLCATNQLNYTVKEMQTRSGYIMFVDNNNKVFLASVIYVSSNKSMLKIAPCDNVYNFTVTTPNNMFNYIEANKDFTIQYQ